MKILRHPVFSNLIKIPLLLMLVFTHPTYANTLNRPVSMQGYYKAILKFQRQGFDSSLVDEKVKKQIPYFSELKKKYEENKNLIKAVKVTIINNQIKLSRGDEEIVVEEFNSEQKSIKINGAWIFPLQHKSLKSLEEAILDSNKKYSLLDKLFIPEAVANPGASIALIFVLSLGALIALYPKKRYVHHETRRADCKGLFLQVAKRTGKFLQYCSKNEKMFPAGRAHNSEAIRARYKRRNFFTTLPYQYVDFVSNKSSFRENEAISPLMIYSLLERTVLYHGPNLRPDPSITPLSSTQVARLEMGINGDLSTREYYSPDVCNKLIIASYLREFNPMLWKTEKMSGVRKFQGAPIDKLKIDYSLVEKVPFLMDLWPEH